MLCGTNGAVAAMDRAYMSLRARKPLANKTSEQSSPFRRWTTGSGTGSSYRHHDHRTMYNKQMSEGSSPVAGTGGGGATSVARWSLGLEQLLADPAGAAAFAHFLAKEFAAENIRFWWSCEHYSSMEEGSARVALANEIWQRHLAEGASEPVNVDASARRAAALLLYHDPPPPDLFQQAQKQIFNVMKFDSYPRFLRSAVHAECARADLRGLPPPYQLHQGHQGQHGTPPRSPNKLKKSASNASERRRSGGASLLPWKLRATSRERNAPTQQTDTPPVTDVVKSSQSAPGQCSLCRVVLPDGATSVVGVDPGVTVGRLVDRLLQRRNLLCTAYDVLVKDATQSGAVEANAPSVVLGGREVVVERRAVVRVVWGGRCVAVRCRPARRLRHVVRPVLARLAPGHLRAAVLRDGLPLHPDTLMQELDGARLQIVDLAEDGEVEEARLGARTDTRDDDTDSLSDLALRLHDEQDAQNGSTPSESRANIGNGSASLVGGIAGGNAGGRVRAALRPGPPLHHHPPDFLENLRETQRQRLQGKPEPLPGAPVTPLAPPSPLTPPPTAVTPQRTPPPLPPKPSQRTAPTVV